MNQLDDVIKRLIRAEGPITVARYMQLALHHPEHGYYVKAKPVGASGDFTTATEISQMFGEMVGLWCLEMWQLSGSPNPFVLFEMGAGRGTLLQDALRATQNHAAFHAAMRLYLLETNIHYQSMQKEVLSDFHPCHIASLDLLPACPVFTVANEFLDAMPVHQYEQTQNGWREMMVGVDLDAFVFTHSQDDPLLPLPLSLPFYEVSPQAIRIVREVTEHIVQYGGASLWVDYGYSLPDGKNTLQAVSGHQKTSPLGLAGDVDLTAHIDFSALRLAAERAGGHVLPLATQQAFLKAMGIEIRAARLKLNATESQRKEIDVALSRLIDASQMGTLFKVMAVTPKPINEMPGFL